MERRLFLSRSLATTSLMVAAAAGLLVPLRALARWPAAAFNARKLQPAMQGLLGNEATLPTDQIAILTKDIAENGSSVPVTLNSKLPNTEVIYLFAEKNPAPALAEFMFTDKVDPEVSCRIKLGQTGNLIAVARADGKLYRTQRYIKVAAGGCAINSDDLLRHPLRNGADHGEA